MMSDLRSWMEQWAEMEARENGEPTGTQVDGAGLQGSQVGQSMQNDDAAIPIMQDFKQYNAPVQPPVTSHLPPPNEGMSVVGDSPVNQDVAQLFELEDDDDERVGMPQSTMQQSQQPKERVQLPSLGRFKLNGGEPLRAVQQEQSVPDDDDEDGGFDPFRIVT